MEERFWDGIDVDCPIMHHITGDAANEEGLRQLIHDNAARLPGIRGYVIEGFHYDGWPESLSYCQGG